MIWKNNNGGVKSTLRPFSKSRCMEFIYSLTSVHTCFILVEHDEVAIISVDKCLGLIDASLGRMPQCTQASIALMGYPSSIKSFYPLPICLYSPEGLSS